MGRIYVQTFRSSFATVWCIKKHREIEIISTLQDKHITQLEYYYDKQDPAVKECLLALKAIVLDIDEAIVHVRKFQIPVFQYKKFDIGYLWIHKKKILLGFVEDRRTMPSTLGKCKNKYESIEVKPQEDIPLELITKKYRTLIQKYDSFLTGAL